jgi:hypothetical protein
MENPAIFAGCIVQFPDNCSNLAVCAFEAHHCASKVQSPTSKAERFTFKVQRFTSKAE